MRTRDVDESLIGLRVKGVFTGLKVTGVIYDIVEYRNEQGRVCSKGVMIELDSPVNWGGDWYEAYESTARVEDDWGNLQHTELID